MGFVQFAMLLQGPLGPYETNIDNKLPMLPRRSFFYITATKRPVAPGEVPVEA